MTDINGKLPQRRRTWLWTRLKLMEVSRGQYPADYNNQRRNNGEENLACAHLLLPEFEQNVSYGTGRDTHPQTNTYLRRGSTARREYATDAPGP